MGQLDIAGVRAAYANGFELRFQSLFNEGRALAFPCDEGGRVDMDSMSERTLDNYLCARALLGREYAHPVVRRRF